MTVVEPAPAPRSAQPVAYQPQRRAVPDSPRPPWVTPVVIGLAIFAALAGWLGLYLGPLSGLQESRAQATNYALFREQLASGVTPPPPFAPHSVLRAGDPVALLNIPAIGMENIVVSEGTTSADLESGPGHLPGTVLPGETGVSALLGRAVGFGGPFGALSKLRAGDPITVTTGQGTYHFAVVDVRGPGQAIPGSLASAASRLVLVTAANDGWRNLWVPTHAIYVDAVIKGKPGAVAPGTTPVTADSPMQGDTSGLFVLVLWLQLLLIAAVVAAWSVVKWGGWQVWVIGAPVLVALLWVTSGQFVHLLPNLL